jgi:NAD(P)-dependent dehydrogenase (short-subunit alcohol dehydrogenase family)
MRGLKGKRVVLGGGSTGIGAALALRLIDEGAHVVVGDVNAQGLNELVPALARKGKAAGVVFDLADEAKINHLVERAVAEMGGIDGLVIPGADIAPETMGNDRDVLHMDPAIWTRMFRVNTLGHALLMKATIPHLVKAGGGSIVTISSGSAHRGLKQLPSYAVTKAGLHALMRHVARICGKDNIRCNAVAPGLVPTEGAKANLTAEIKHQAVSAMCTPRLGEPEDVGALIAFLLSDDAAWLTGQVISINGGTTFRE